VKFCARKFLSSVRKMTTESSRWEPKWPKLFAWRWNEDHFAFYFHLSTHATIDVTSEKFLICGEREWIWPFRIILFIIISKKPHERESNNDKSCKQKCTPESLILIAFVQIMCHHIFQFILLSHVWVKVCLLNAEARLNGKELKSDVVKQNFTN
jgi:hypothetical protein